MALAGSDGTAGLWLWRHPRAQGANGRCIGRTDLPVDRRRAKRLAHRVRATARRYGLPRVVWTSPLQRCAQVGRWLRRWGWQHQADARLSELDFGRWDGRAWQDVPPAEVAQWEARFAEHAPGGGEALSALLARALAFLQEQAGPQPLLVVGHAGWMQALAWHGAHAQPPRAEQWPAPPRHGTLLRLPHPAQAGA
ncbi:histidine phosphatase family protein [Ideonella sp. BN130291]|uniref:histidine phosphatase family protein n=1 Tax=Ideonella sp. BN130291 TaxID=3112940 RepID=UPI002E2585BD|nr:histidine phosphatase family protein [Ideonella sp. BN130291]